jgi:hypothetical protein
MGNLHPRRSVGVSRFISMGGALVTRPASKEPMSRHDDYGRDAAQRNAGAFVGSVSPSRKVSRGGIRLRAGAVAHAAFGGPSERAL